MPDGAPTTTTKNNEKHNVRKQYKFNPRNNTWTASEAKKYSDLEQEMNELRSTLDSQNVELARAKEDVARKEAQIEELSSQTGTNIWGECSTLWRNGWSQHLRTSCDQLESECIRQDNCVLHAQLDEARTYAMDLIQGMYDMATACSTKFFLRQDFRRSEEQFLQAHPWVMECTLPSNDYELDELIAGADDLPEYEFFYQDNSCDRVPLYMRKSTETSYCDPDFCQELAMEDITLPYTYPHNPQPMEAYHQPEYRTPSPSASGHYIHHTTANSQSMTALSTSPPYPTYAPQPHAHQMVPQQHHHQPHNGYTQYAPQTPAGAGSYRPEAVVHYKNNINNNNINMNNNNNNSPPLLPGPPPSMNPAPPPMNHLNHHGSSMHFAPPHSVSVSPPHPQQGQQQQQGPHHHVVNNFRGSPYQCMPAMFYQQQHHHHKRPLLQHPPQPHPHFAAQQQQHRPHC